MKRFRVLSGPFRGTPILADWQNGKRKALGVYEHETNAWWEEKLDSIDLFYDVGAADGFFTRGVAHRMRRKNKTQVIAFEPGMHSTNLTNVLLEKNFSGVTFDLIPLLVGDQKNDKMTTLDSHLLDPQKRALVKIDVEGAELEVMAGASKMLQNPAFDWTIEIHGKELIAPVRAVFEKEGRDCQIIEPKPHWLFGPENRTEWTHWLITT